MRSRKEVEELEEVEEVEEMEEEEEVEGLVEWDWIGENSPMLSDMTEAEWILERLCESLNRYTRRQAKLVNSSSSPSPSIYNPNNKYR